MNKTTPEERLAIVRYIVDGNETAEAMAELFRISTGRVYQILAEAGYRRVWRWERVA